MTIEVLGSVREVDGRFSDGLQVRLLWCKDDGSVWVSVLDVRTGEAFRLEVADDESPLDVFYHPFAYAHARALVRFPDAAAANAGSVLPG
jgi:hypothetical protein